jgi:adsorption protein A
MNRVALLAAALAAAAPLAAGAAAPVDLGPGVSDYQRFMVYPHLQRGFDALARGDYATATESFERARGYAPRSAAVALYLADAYRRAGRADRAERVLEEQRRYTPRDARLVRIAAHPGVRPVAAPVTAPTGSQTPPSVPAASTTQAAAASASRVKSAAVARPRVDGRAESLRIARAISAALAAGDTREAERLLATVPPDSFPEARLSIDLASGRIAAGRERARALVAAAPRDADLLDRVSYRLMAGGDSATAARLLLDAWPSPLAARSDLITRLTGLLATSRYATATDLARLRMPVPGAAAAQVRLLAAAGECEAGHRIANGSDAMTSMAWSSLAACVGDDPAAALAALRKAVASAGDSAAFRGLAYRAFEQHDYATALSAWSSLPVGELSADHLLAAATTAVAADRPADAAHWLDEYERRAVPPTDAYWWLRALSGPRGGANERNALEHAIALREDARYLGRLAQVQTASGDVAGAVASLQHAHSLAPDDETVSAALGYALSAEGRPADALPLLAAYQSSHPNEAAVAEDLAELHRRLVHPGEARSMAATAIDLRGAGADADGLFRLRRLHEQLGRSWSVNADLSLGDSIAGTNTAIPGGAYRSYAQVEVDRRLGHAIGRPDGDALSVYGRVFAGAQGGGVWPDDLPTLGVGLRWKPFETRIVYLAIERQFALDKRGARGDDTLLRVSAAPLTDPRIGDDWHASGTGWWSHVIYLDAAHYLRAGDSVATADYQVGHHFKVGDGATLQPFGRVQWNGRWQAGGFDTDARVGLGLRWNRWYGGDAHDAWRHRLVVGLELQQALVTYLPDRRTFFMNVGNYW